MSNESEKGPNPSDDKKLLDNLLEFIVFDRASEGSSNFNSITSSILENDFRKYVSHATGCKMAEVFPRYYSNFSAIKKNLRKALYIHSLESNTPTIIRRVTLSGVTASGKTTFCKVHPEGQDIFKNPSILFDEAAIKGEKDYRLSIDHKAPLEIIFVYRDILECAKAYVTRSLQEHTHKTHKDTSLEKKSREFLDLHIEKLESFLNIARGPSKTVKSLASPSIQNQQQNRIQREIGALDVARLRSPKCKVYYNKARANLPIKPPGNTFKGASTGNVLRPIDNSMVLANQQKAATSEDYIPMSIKTLEGYLEQLTRGRAQYEKKVLEIFQPLQKLYPSQKPANATRSTLGSGKENVYADDVFFSHMPTKNSPLLAQLSERHR